MDKGINSMVETMHQLEAENEKLKFRLSNVMLSFLNFVQEQKPTMVNHGEKINLFELERLIDKFKNEA